MPPSVNMISPPTASPGAQMKKLAIAMPMARTTST
jgi:hypothetical protein